MSIGTLTNLWAQVQSNAAAQNSASGTTTESNQDWLESLLSATGSATNAGGISATSALSDQMQAMLVQLQGGNTVAPDASGSTTASSTPAGTTEAVSGHHHHHHHGGTQGVDEGTDDVASDAANNLTGNDASGLDNSSGGFMQNLQTMLTTVGSAAAQGAATGAVIAAL